MARPLAAPSLAAGGPPGARTAWLLGIAGLVPFFVSSAALWAGPGRIGPAVFFAPILLLAYAATIASFLGGARWGAEIARPAGPRPIFLVSAVAPQLAALALVAAPLPAADRYAGLALVLLVQGVGDALSPDLPAWYRSLRIPLTVGAVAAVLGGLAWVLTVAAPAR